MYFSFVFCIWVAAFVCVQCEQGHHTKGTFDYTTFHKTDCMGLYESIKGVVNNATCKPHYRHVTLKSMPSQSFYPSVVSVKRCDGYAPGVTCLPTKERWIQVPVKLTQLSPDGSRSNMCALVDVLEHTQCRRMCRQNKEDCKEYEHYVSSQCACVCKDQEMKKDMCEMQMGMFWDEKDCSCKCTYMNMECTTGRIWSREKCDCIDP